MSAIPITSTWAGQQGKKLRQALRAWGIFDAVPSALGQLDLQTPPAAFPDIDSATWQPITQYDNETPTSPRGLTLDAVAGTITITTPGLWRFDFSLSLTHNENNAGRTLEYRLFNVTDAGAIRVSSFAIGRNQPGSNLAVAVAAEISGANLGDALRVDLKMAAGSAGMTTNSFSALAFSATYVDTLDTAQG